LLVVLAKMDDSTMYSNTQNSILNLTGQSSSTVSPLEQKVLDEYERLANNMKEVSLPKTRSRGCGRGVQMWTERRADCSCQLSATLADLSSGPITLEIAEGLRLLERKVASVYTLMKASVYSIVLQQGQMEGAEEGGLDSNDDGGRDDGRG
jgi:DASH complex subunit DAD3